MSEKKEQEPQYLSLRDAADTTGVGLWQIKRYAREGAFPVFQIGEKGYVDIAEFRSWILSRQRGNVENETA
jgi:hypothetical protein